MIFCSAGFCNICNPAVVNTSICNAKKAHRWPVLAAQRVQAIGVFYGAIFMNEESQGQEL